MSESRGEIQHRCSLGLGFRLVDGFLAILRNVLLDGDFFARHLSVVLDLLDGGLSLLGSTIDGLFVVVFCFLHGGLSESLFALGGSFLRLGGLLWLALVFDLDNLLYNGFSLCLLIGCAFFLIISRFFFQFLILFNSIVYLGILWLFFDSGGLVLWRLDFFGISLISRRLSAAFAVSCDRLILLFMGGGLFLALGLSLSFRSLLLSLLWLSRNWLRG